MLEKMLKSACGIVVFCGSVLSSDLSVLDYEKMFSSTSSESTIMEVSLTSLNAGEISDRSSLIEAANSGDYIAQYVISQVNGGEARQKFNGERDALLREKALLLLISAIKGKYWKSKDELKQVVDLDVASEEYSEFSLPQLKQLAQSIHESL